MHDTQEALRVGAVLATGVLAGGILAGAGAWPPESPSLGNVVTANTRSDGYAPAQGHETGTPGYITRINLDADAAHRIALLATKDVTGAYLKNIDGSTWDPWAQRLLFTTESSPGPGVYSATPGYPSRVVSLAGSLGNAAYEGIQNDEDVNLWLAEDKSGASKGGTAAKVPNSFIVRFVPQHPGPEDAIGGWGSTFVVNLRDPSATTDTLTLFYKGDAAHAGFDNVTFISKNQVTFVEDAGDTLHGQRNALDSGWLFDVDTDYSHPTNEPVRWLAEGRDPSATIDAGTPGGFGNEGDNEITGAIVSNGDPGADGILGARPPKLWQDDWRWFYTQQHGDNWTYEVIPARGG